ncbi:MAG: FAD-dependent oxidoreductase [Bacteroidota bacterium]
MKRRKFLQLSGMGVAATPLVGSLATPLSGRKSAPGTSSEVIVIGAGTFGVWTAYHLQQMGATVTLLDAYGPGNSRASSGGETRLIQADNDQGIYVQSAIRAYAWWKKMEEESGEKLVYSTGRLSMSQQETYRQDVLNRQAQHQSQGINNTELLDQDEIRYRWPQIYSDDITSAMYNDGGPSGSTLMARKGIQTIARQFEKNGGRLRIAQGMPILSKGKVEGIELRGEKTLRAQTYVFACGPWLCKMFPDLLLPRLQVERRDVLFVGTPAGDDRFSYPNLPEWSVTGSGYYGFPNIEGRGLKVAPYPDYNSFDPDIDERLVNPYQAKRAHDFVKQRFPALEDQPITESRVCQVTNSIDHNFVVDQLPSSENTFIVGGGSGHGFKHGPAIGEYAAKRILGQETDQELDRLFRLKEKVFGAE